MPNKNAYLKPNRLPDVLAGIQIMALYERHRNSTKRWAGILSGDEEQGPYWKRVFDEHPEFFRKSANPEHEGDYSLLWRRALPQIYHRRQRKNLSDEELERIPHQERDRYVVRPSVPESQIKTLMDTAIELHQKAAEAHRDRRWWIPTAFSILGIIIGVALKSVLDKI